MKTICIALLACLIVLTQLSGTYAYYDTGNDLLQHWHAHQRTVQNRQVSTDLVDKMYLMGYVTGIADIALDIPTTVTRRQLVDIVERYLEAHPEERHEPGVILVLKALRSVFPPSK
jgi:hypothetical protein